MHIVISNTSDLPIYVQIKEQVKEQILSGELEEDEMLPSLRQLAKDLKISVLTTTRAYNELEEEGFITSRQGKGFFVMSSGCSNFVVRTYGFLHNCVMHYRRMVYRIDGY